MIVFILSHNQNVLIHYYITMMGKQIKTLV